jgi:hypothetical protein
MLARIEKNLRVKRLKFWLGGLDSNQDNQIQNLMYCQLYDLPAGAAGQQKRPQARPGSTLLADGNFVNGQAHPARRLVLRRRASYEALFAD